jgi:hypothetical protein
MADVKHTPPFEVTQGCEEYIVIDGNGYTMARCEARFDSATKEFFDQGDAKERAEQIAAALNVAYYLAKAVGSNHG